MPLTDRSSTAITSNVLTRWRLCWCAKSLRRAPHAPLIDASHYLAPFGSLRGLRFGAAQPPVSFGECLLLVPEETGVGNRGARAERGEGGEGLETHVQAHVQVHVQAHVLPGLRQRRRLGTRARERHIPLAGATAAHGRMVAVLGVPSSDQW